MNREAICRKAIENQLYTLDELNKMNDNEVYDLIFASGFSTAKEVTEISGRGVGMDMVRKSVEQACGRIIIESNPGSGSCFSIHLPIPKSVLIFNSLLVRTGQNTVALPQDSIYRVLRIDESNNQELLHELEGSRYLKLENRLLPLFDLSAALSERKEADRETSNVIVVEGRQSLFGLIVDEIFEVEDTVSKKLPGLFHFSPVFSGATFLGDDDIGLTVDIEALEEKLNQRQRQTEALKADQVIQSAESSSGQRKLLLIHQESGNYFAFLVNDIDRLEKLQKNSVKLTGNQSVAIVRNQVLPLFQFRDLVSGNYRNAGRFEPSTEEFDCIILSMNGKLIGIAVDHVDDLIDSDVETDPGGRETFIDGNIIVSGRTHSLINVRALINAIDRLGKAGTHEQAAA